jgi:hypothetical protein
MLNGGLNFCVNCQQIVDMYSEDNKVFECPFCSTKYNNKGELIIKDVWKVKSTPENLEKVFSAVWYHMPDNHGWGELDEETGIMRCVEWVIEHLLESGDLNGEEQNVF